MKRTKMLKKNYEFKRVLSKGVFYSGRYIQAVILKRKPEIELNYLGLAISVKIGKAVKRNRVKRLIKEAYTCLEEEILTGNQIVFMWNKKVNPDLANYNLIKEDMLHIFDKAKIYAVKGEK